jgi:hypothetical protein
MRNRQRVILEAMKELKEPPQIPRIAIFSDAQASKMLNKSVKQVQKRVTKLRIQLGRVLGKPTKYDPVYKVFQRIFHRDDHRIVLTRDNKLRHSIRRLALRRFLHGDPPRKPNDTSMGDAFNWEWMIHCASENSAELLIVSRDADYGVLVGDKTYVNDDLRREFSERVSRRKKLLLYQKLSDALKHFEIAVTKQEQEAEIEIVNSAIAQRTAEDRSGTWRNMLTMNFDEYLRSSMQTSETLKLVKGPIKLSGDLGDK